MTAIATTRTNPSSHRWYSNTAVKLMTAGLIFAGVGLQSAQANELKSTVYKPIQGLSYHFGSKIAVGYFTQANAACALTMFLAEDAGDTAGSSAARLEVRLAPEQDMKLKSVEGETLEVKCGPSAATLEVKSGSAPALRAPS